MNYKAVGRRCGFVFDKGLLPDGDASPASIWAANRSLAKCGFTITKFDKDFWLGLVKEVVRAVQLYEEDVRSELAPNCVDSASFAQYLFGRLGIGLPRSYQDQWDYLEGCCMANELEPVRSLTDAQVADIFFFERRGGMGYRYRVGEKVFRVESPLRVAITTKSKPTPSFLAATRNLVETISAFDLVSTHKPVAAYRLIPNPERFCVISWPERSDLLIESSKDLTRWLKAARQGLHYTNR